MQRIERQAAGELKVGRILSEDKDFAIIEVAKNQEVEFNLNEGDRFMTMVFVHQVEGTTLTWDPFKEGK